MEFVILGLLALRAMTIYDINKALEKGISLFYSASFGSINAAIGKMLTKGWLSAEEKVENGRNKKVFSLTPAGQQAFQAWLGSEIDREKVKDPALTRLFFMGMLPIEQRIPLLEAHIDSLRQTLDALNIIRQSSINMQVEDALRDIFDYQLFTLQYGCDFYTFNINWYQSLLEKLKKQSPAL